MHNCLTCKQICNSAGQNQGACEKYMPIKTSKMKTKNIFSAPKRIVVESATNGKQIEYVSMDLVEKI